MSNKDKIILDLCGGTGSWSKPYKEAGFTVFNITLPDYDVGDYYFSRDDGIISFKDGEDILIKNIYGILAAPPCTMFSFARTNAKTPRDLEEGFGTVHHCLEIIWSCQTILDSDQQKYSPLKFWALENPYYAMTKWFLGEPCFVFDPWEFGHNYKKKTGIWGYFKKPQKTVMIAPKVDGKEMPKFDMLTMDQIRKMKSIAGSRNQLDYWKNTKTRKMMRAITPAGFAQAFFKANGG